MEMKLRQLIFVLLAIALAVIPVPAQPSYTGAARGSLTVDGKSIPLRYAYVVEVDNVEEAGLLLGGPQQYQVIVLCDRALPLSSVANRNAPYAERHSPGELMEPLRKSVADQMYAVLLQVELRKSTPFQAQLFYPDKESIGFSISGTQYADRLTGLKREGDWLSGTALLAPAQQTHLEKGPKKYQYRVTFRAPVLKEKPVTAQWEGKAALDCPPVRAIREYLAAARKGDVPALRRLTAATHQSYLDNPQVLKFLRSGDAAKLAEQVRRVIVRTDTATVIVVNEKPTYSQVSMHLVREQGAWKLYWP